jgi:hypothetical protein
VRAKFVDAGINPGNISGSVEGQLSFNPDPDLGLFNEHRSKLAFSYI